MILQHNTTDAFYRSPLGALTTGTQVRLRVAVSGPGEPDTVELRVWDGKEQHFPMRPLGARDGKRYYEVQVTVSEKPCLYWYRFEAVASDGVRHVLGAPDDSGCGEGRMGPTTDFQITVYDADYKTPEWMYDGVMYQIMVDRFYHGKGTDALMHAKDETNHPELHENWNDMPSLNVTENGDNFATDFFGGNLEGVRQKLPYLKELGVNVIYFNPIFTARTNHKYDTGDYMQVDPMFGDEKKLHELCEEAKAMGIRIMLDGVFSHVGSDSVYFNRRGTHGEKVGAFRDPDSPYKKWFTFKNWPNDYECWWGFRTLPNVNEMDEDFRKYILNGEDSVVKHWVRQGTSGWRLDVADELPMDFLRELRRETGRQLGRKGGLYRALTGAIHTMKEAASQEGFDALSVPPDFLFKAMERVREQAAEQLALGAGAVAADSFSLANAYLFAAGRFDERYALLTSGGEKHARIELALLSAAQEILSVTKAARGVVYFSATLAPFDFTKTMLGSEEGDACLLLPSPFDPAQLEARIAPIDIRYQSREKTAPQVAGAIYDHLRQHGGHTIVFFPSYAYMARIGEILLGMDNAPELIREKRGMTEEEKNAVLSLFEGKERVILLAVLGGAFSEGIDLPGDRLKNVIIVSTGLPQTDEKIKAMQAYYDAQGHDGFYLCMTLPGMIRVIQAAGRLIRTSSDTGTLLLIDSRFRYSGIRALMSGTLAGEALNNAGG